MTAKSALQIVVAATAAISAIIAGTCLGWSNPAWMGITNGELGIMVNEYQFSWIAAWLTVGAAITSIPTGIVLNIFGRKWTLLFLTVPVLVGWTIMIFINNLYVMYTARFLMGISTGTYCVGVPLYIGEIAQKEIRGMLGAFFQLSITVGILLVFIFGAIFTVRWMNVACGIISIVYFVAFFFMPESPVFLIKKEKLEQAENVMHFLRGKDYDFSGEISEIKQIEAKIRDNPVPVWVAIKRRASVKAILIGLGLMLFQQLSGINAVIFYSTDIFTAAKTGMSPRLSTIIIGIIQVIATIIAVLTVDLLGRRLLLMISGAVMALSTTALGVCFFLQEHTTISLDKIGWLPLVSLCVFIVMFSFGYGPVPWIVMGEIFASDIKGVGASLATTLNWCLAFVVTKSFVNIKQTLGTGQTFWIFSIISIIGVFFVWFFVLETKGKSLNEIQEILQGDAQ